MKQLLFILLISGSYLVASAQNDLGKSNDNDRIAIDIFIPPNIESIPEHARSLLQSKLTQIAAQQGLSGSGDASRFLLTAKMELLTKNITPTTPPVETYTFDTYLYIVDNIERIILSSTSLSTKAAGTNKTRAYTNGLTTINENNPQIRKFLSDGKQEIIRYYNAKCDFIIANANSLASQNRFEEAIFTLSSVPEVCKECYMKSLKAIEPIFQEYLNHECASFLSRARGLFAANPNATGASDAIEMLALIDPDSECFDEADELIGKIEQKMRQDETRDWNFMRDVYGNQVELERLRIEAYRDVGVAFGENQRSNYDVLWLFD